MRVAFIVLNGFYSFRTENALKNHKNICKDQDCCYVKNLYKDNNILKYNSGEKYMRVPFIMYIDMECFLENISTSRNDPNKSSTTKTEDCMKMICKELKEHAKRVIYCEKKQMISLTDEENESYENQEFCYICKKRFTKDNKKVKHFTGKHRGAAHNKCNMIIKYQKIFQSFFMMVLRMIIIL